MARFPTPSAVTPTVLPPEAQAELDQRLIRAAKANLGWTAMQEAILLNDGSTRQQEVVRLLLEAGADPGIRDPQGRTALQNAERLGFAGIAAMIRGG